MRRLPTGPEAKLAPKEPWLLPRKSSALFDEYLQLIQGFEISIARIQGIFKLGQNKSPQDMAAQALAFRARETEGGDQMAGYLELHNPLPKHS